MAKAAAFLSRITRIAVIGAALSALAVPAMADSFSFSISSGPGYRHGHHRHHHHRHWYRHHHPRVIYVPPPRVIYAPPPRVVYEPAYVGAPVQIVPSPAPPYRAADGRYCREYQAVITVDGRHEPAYGTACQAPDGSWRIAG